MCNPHQRDFDGVFKLEDGFANIEQVRVTLRPPPRLPDAGDGCPYIAIYDSLTPFLFQKQNRL